MPGSGSGGSRIILEDLSSNGAKGLGTQVNGRPVPAREDHPPRPQHPAGLVPNSSAAPGSAPGPRRWIELRDGDRIALLLRNGVERYVFKVSIM